MTDPFEVADPYPGLDGQTAQRIVIDVGQGTAIESSKVNYGPVERQFRIDVEEDMSRHPGAMIDMPGDDLGPPPEIPPRNFPSDSVFNRLSSLIASELRRRGHE